MRRLSTNNRNMALYLLASFVIGSLTTSLIRGDRVQVQAQEKCEVVEKIVVATPTPAVPTPTLPPVASSSSSGVVADGIYEGQASYYSASGCLGCNKELRMANGQIFDESAMTLAMNHLPLNTDVRVVNIATGKTVQARVTDRGGFNSLGRKISNIVGENKLERIADLSRGLKDALGCGDICQVRIVEGGEE